MVYTIMIVLTYTLNAQSTATDNFSIENTNGVFTETLGLLFPPKLVLHYNLFYQETLFLLQKV